MHKKIILLVDNRVSEEEPNKSTFRGSAFKGDCHLNLATEVDAHEHNELINETFGEQPTFEKLQERISCLERRVEELERDNKVEKVKRRTRRKANQIYREYQVSLELLSVPTRDVKGSMVRRPR
jgi:hypothetical protein